MNNNSATRIEMLKAYIAEDPADPFMQYALALEYVRLNKTVDAITMLENVLKLNPDYLPAYYQLGKLYEKNSRNADALKIYTSGMEVARLQKDLHTLSELQGAFDGLSE